MKRTKPASKPVPPASPTGFAARLGALKKPIVAVASVGAVLSGLVGYYTTYKAVANVQSQASAPSPATAGPSIAVLPFVDMSQAKDQEYFSDGISEELLNLLAKVPQLHVIARTSSFSFKGKNLEIKDIANKLQVAHILEGSVRRSGDTLRITVQLIRTSDSMHLWSETYDRKADDIFKIQDEIAAAVVGQLKIKLLNDQLKTVAIDPNAHALILRGNFMANQHSLQSIEQAIGLYKQALDIAPRAASAWVGLSHAYRQQASYSDLPSEQSVALVRQAAQQALAIDPNNAAAENMLGFVALIADHDIPSKAAHSIRALELDPGSVPALTGFGHLLLEIGRDNEALATFNKVAALDPANAENYHTVATLHSYHGRYQLADEYERTALSLSPNYYGAQFFLGLNEVRQGHLVQAKTLMQAIPIESTRTSGLAIVEYSLGHRAESDAAIQLLIQKYASSSAISIAWAYAFRNEYDKAFEWLDKAVQTHDAGIYFANGDPVFQPMHNDPRWLTHQRRLGLAPEQLAKLKFDVNLPAKTGTVK